MSKKKKGPGDEVASTLTILNKPISEHIDEVLGEIEYVADPCYDSHCCGGCGSGSIDGRYDAGKKLEKLFEQYLQAELQLRGINDV